jgi:hypothetical protein
VRGLAPYHWSHIASPFSWVAFGGFLRAPWDFGLLTLLQKSFWYGSAVWLLRAAGWRLARAAIAVAVLLGAIEVIQIHLPGRVAEITDPLLALLLAITLGLLDRSESVLSQLVVDEGSHFRGGVALIGWRKTIARSLGRASHAPELFPANSEIYRESRPSSGQIQRQAKANEALTV